MKPPSQLKNAMDRLLGPDSSTPGEQGNGTADYARKTVKRLKLWELNDKHHCPVIGTCLPINELSKLAHRFLDLADSRDEFAMHVKIVAHANSRNPLSEAIQKHLERKYQTQIRSFEQAKSDPDVLAAWQQSYAHGDVAGALWAAITHKCASAETQQRVFANVHMLSHQIGAGQAADARRLARLEKDSALATAALEKQKRTQARNETHLRQQLLKATDELDRLRQTKGEAEKLQARLASFESGAAMKDMGRKLLSLQTANEELMSKVQRSWALEKTLKAAHEEAQALARERDQLTAERDALERMLLAGETDQNADSDCEGQCSTCDAASLGQCVLYVGGRSSLLAQYRALAGRLGFRLIHHDGGLEESLSRLPDMIRGADAVMCPTDCVSHSAYYQLKRQCKQSGKPCLLFKGAGVSGFAVALARLSAGQCSLPVTP